MNGWGDLGSRHPWSPPPPRGAPAPLRAEALRGFCFCLLYDLCCWLAGVRRAVPRDVDEYTVTGLREVEDPRERLSRYVSPALLQSWEKVLRPFFQGGFALEPELGEAGAFHERGQDSSGHVRAELRFGNRSSVVDASQRHHRLPPGEWILTVWLSPELGGYVENATIQQA
jgi:hypothetical protein